MPKSEPEPVEAVSAEELKKLPPLPILEHFKFEHLPPDLAAFCGPVCELAQKMAAELPPSAELVAGLRKLLEARDCFRRAGVDARVKKADRPKALSVLEGS